MLDTAENLMVYVIKNEWRDGKCSQRVSENGQTYIKHTGMSEGYERLVGATWKGQPLVTKSFQKKDSSWHTDSHILGKRRIKRTTEIF